MTAINPANLIIRCTSVAELYQDPAQFVPALHQLLSAYAKRVRRTGGVRSRSKLASYQVPPQVISTLLSQLKPYLQNSPSPGVVLADALWNEKWLEFRLLAASLLGRIPDSEIEPITQRLIQWASSAESDDIRTDLVRRICQSRLKEPPRSLSSTLDQLLTRPSNRKTEAAIALLQLLAEDRNFVNFPQIYRYLDLILAPVEETFQFELRQLLRTLAQRSEQETFPFLVNQIQSAGKPRILRLVRELLPEFSPEHQAILKNSLRDQQP
jgi:hypothetical protein